MSHNEDLSLLHYVLFSNFPSQSFKMIHSLFKIENLLKYCPDNKIVLFMRMLVQKLGLNWWVSLENTALDLKRGIPKLHSDAKYYTKGFPALLWHLAGYKRSTSKEIMTVIRQSIYFRRHTCQKIQFKGSSGWLLINRIAKRWLSELIFVQISITAKINNWFWFILSCSLCSDLFCQHMLKMYSNQPYSKHICKCFHVCHMLI